MAYVYIFNFGGFMSKRRYKNFFNENTKSRKMYVVATQMKALDALKPNMIFKIVSGMVVCELGRI